MSRAMSGFDPFASSPQAAAPDHAAVDPMTHFPLPDPDSTRFTIDQVWPRQIEASPVREAEAAASPATPIGAEEAAAKPAWMAALLRVTQS